MFRIRHGHRPSDDDGDHIMPGYSWRRAYHRTLGRDAPALRRSIVVLIVGFLVTSALLGHAPWELAVILGWDVGAATFLASTVHLIARADAADTERLAAEEDATRTTGHLVIVTVCIVSLLGVGFAIRLADSSSEPLRVVLIAVAVLTVAVSWLTMNTVYILRYAYLCYGPANGGMDFGDPETRARPTYGDLAYVALTIGMTYQVSDTVLRDPRTRRTVLTHAVLAYVFGVVIIAGAVNLIAGLMR
jgi:uncharacterized membrane protein